MGWDLMWRPSAGSKWGRTGPALVGRVLLGQ